MSNYLQFILLSSSKVEMSSMQIVESLDPVSITFSVIVNAFNDAFLWIYIDFVHELPDHT